VVRKCSQIVIFQALSVTQGLSRNHLGLSRCANPPNLPVQVGNCHHVLSLPQKLAQIFATLRWIGGIVSFHPVDRLDVR
jgi:hypothetical protein